MHQLSLQSSLKWTIVSPWWQVELRQKSGSSVVDAVFFCPAGIGYKAFADARREAMRASKE
jgi:hypothetical protein